MFVALENVLQLQEGYVAERTAGNRAILLVHVGGRTVAWENRCPHGDVPLHQGTFAGQQVRCAGHGIEFDLLTGACLKKQCPDLRPVRLAYEGREVGIDL